MESEKRYLQISGTSGSSRLKLLFLLVALTVLVVFYFRTPRPCKDVLTYRIGTVDERFGISHQEFADSVRTAASLWGKPSSRELFREDPKGIIEINLIYDYRQEASDKLKHLNYKIENTRSSYDDLKNRFENLKAEYVQKKSDIVSDLNMYNTRVNVLSAEIEAGRQRGGVPQDVYKRIMMEKEELNAIRDNLQARQEEMNKMADTINNMVVVINEIATNTNLDLVQYHDAGKPLSGEFCEGNYIIKDGKKTMTIFQFDNGSRLVRVLTHEFGHALGLNHSDNPDAVMYRLIQSDSIELTPADITALKARCGGS
ncbi:MAG: matrixin family metalloprotease [Syntrophaceae bacterium]